MRAQNLSISIPNKGCNKTCPYCISNITPGVESCPDLFLMKLPKAKKLAEHANISSVSLTGKGEPTLNMPMIAEVTRVFQEYPLEIQTNGIKILENPNLTLGLLANYCIDVIAISFDDVYQFVEHRGTFSKIRELGMSSRVTFNITDRLPEDFSLNQFFELCSKYGVDQFSLRNITAPAVAVHNETTQWIMDNTQKHNYEKLLGDFQSSAFAIRAKFIGATAYGGKIYDVDGVSFTYFDNCLQEAHYSDDIRSLIYQEDGHMYTTWNSKASRIF